MVRRDGRAGPLLHARRSLLGPISMRTSLEEGIKLHRFAGMFPEQFSTEAGRHREAVVAADQRMVIRCFCDDLAGFVHDASHVRSPIQRAALLTLKSGDIVKDA